MDKHRDVKQSIDGVELPQQKAARTDEILVLERSYDWLPPFDTGNVILLAYRPGLPSRGRPISR